MHNSERLKGGKVDAGTASVASSWSSSEDADFADCSLPPLPIDNLDSFLLGAVPAADEEEASF